MKRLVIIAVAVAALAIPVVAAASCPQEQTARCPSFTYRVHGRTHHPRNIRYSLNGRPQCGHAKTLIKTWYKRGGDRIFDPTWDGYWFLESRNPMEFTAGLCGDLKWR